MATEQVWPQKGIYAAFGAVALAFVLSTLYAQHRATEIQSSARSISENAAPSIESLSIARAELEALVLLVVSGRDTDSEVARVEARLNEAVRYDQSLPYRFPGEEAAQSEVTSAVATFFEAVDKLRKARTKSRNPMTELSRLEVAERAALGALSRSIALNAEEAHVAAARIEAIREHSTLLAYLLSAVCVALAVLSAVVAGRAVSRHATLIGAYARLQGNRAAELEMFASRVAHDLTSPLQPVALALHLLESRMTGDARGQELTQRGRAGLQRAKNLVEALLEFARSGAQPDLHSSASVGAVVKGLYEEIQPSAAAERIQLTVEPIPPCRVACAPGVLASVLQNLVRNALKYMGEGRAERRVVVRARLEGDRVRFEVQDSGPGVLPGRESRLFEPYVRGAGDRPGLGLGLATVKRLVESHRGRVGVVTTPGKGCTFWFELPGNCGGAEDSLVGLHGRRLSQELPVVMPEAQA